jgi:hypothetical protein
MPQSTAKNANCSSDEVVECFMNVLFAKFDIVFSDIAIKKDIALDGLPRKM